VPVVELVVDAADAELAADDLWQAGPSAVSEVDVGAGRVRLLADVLDPERVPDRWRPRMIQPDVAADLDAWRAWASPWRAGQHLVLQPTWLAPAEVRADDVVVRLDPGRAFGSGSHPSTRLALGELEDEIRAGSRVLDVGCGSGVLAVTAALLGAQEVIAVDVDPAAVAATLSNAAANDVREHVRASTTPVEAVTGFFDLVLANIGAGVLRDLADPIQVRVAPAGRLVLAGLLDAQVDETVAAYARCTEIDRRSEEGWSVVVLRC
jgi:ribosomal protein L11 methyltransferase